MKRTFLFLVLPAIALSAGACQKHDPVGVESAPKALRVSGVVQLPFKGVFSGTTAMIGPCAGGAGLLAEVTGRGHATYVGSSTVDMAVCSDPVTQQPLAPVTSTITAANGDQIVTAMVGGWIDETTGETISQWIITGGTGRFQDATGEFTNRGVHNPDLSWATRSEGWISFGLR